MLKYTLNMIYDSRPWKEELNSISKKITDLLQKRKTDKCIAQIEKNIMIGCFCIRRLNESKKLSAEFNQIQLKSYQYAPLDTNSLPTYYNRIDVERFYDTNNLCENNPKNISIRYFCNQIIHSFVFTFLSGNKSERYIMFSSDLDKKKYINIISIAEISFIFREASQDYIDFIKDHKDSNTKEWVTTGYRKRPT